MAIKNEEKERKLIVSEIIEKIDSINLLMKKHYKIKLFKIQEQKIWNSLSEPCQNEEKDFLSHITALSKIIEWINTKELKDSLKIESKTRSINYLERFLQENILIMI